MGLDRDELAARFAVVAYGDGNPCGTQEDIAAYAVRMADALLSALTPTPPPREEGTGGKYEPKVGDVVRWKSNNKDYLVCEFHKGEFWYTCQLGERYPKDSVPSDVGDSEWWDYLRPATASERAAAGLPPCPPPPPADARGEAYKALLAYAECEEADDSWDVSPWLDAMARAGWDGKSNAILFLNDLRKKALALARKAEGGAS